MTTNITTTKQLHAAFVDIASRHKFINSFIWGEDFDIGASSTVVYPALIVYPVDSSMIASDEDVYKTIEHTYQIKVVDMVGKDEVNKVDVQSDTLQILTEVVNELNHHPYYQASNLLIKDDINFEPLDEFSDDQTFGWTGTINLKAINNSQFCGLPFDELTGYPLPVNSGSGWTVDTNSTITVANGLTKVGNHITWGGTLEEETIIQGDGNNLQFLDIPSIYFKADDEIIFESDSKLIFFAEQSEFAGSVVFDEWTGAHTGGTLSIDTRLANNFDYTIEGDTSIEFNSYVNGQTIVLALTNDSTGGHNVSFSGVSPTIKWAGGAAPDFTQTSGVTDVFTFIKVNGSLYGSTIQNMY